MSAQFFPAIPKITFDGPKSKTPFSFNHYNPGELVEGKSMRDHLRLATSYWHVMRNPLADPFGGGTAPMPWDDGSNSVANAQKRVRVFFEFLEKIVPSQPAPTLSSGGQEYLENIFNELP